MASDGGFSTKPMGFDKNEVNEYIANLRKKMQEMEAENKANNKKTADALKTAEEADSRIQAAVAEGEKKTAEVQEKLEIATVKADRLSKQIDDLKKQLEDEKRKMKDMLKTGKGVDAQAQKAYAEVLERAEADAKEITDAAKEAAEKIVADAESRRKEADEKLASFMELLRGQLDTINAGYKAVNDSAAELLGAEVAPAPVEIPDFAAMAKPSAPEPEQPKAEEPVKQPEPAPAPKKEEKKAPEPKPEPKKEEPKEEPKKEEPVEASFDDWGGSDLAKSIFEDEEKSKKDVPLMNPDAADPFGADLFSSLGGDNDILTGGFGNTEEKVEDVKPMDNSDHAKAVTDIDFAHDLISQTMTSANLDDSTDESIRKAVMEREAQFAVKPSNVDMDEVDMSEGDKPLSDEDELMKTLRDAEASFGALGMSFGGDSSNDNSSTESSGGLGLGGDWADLQKELEAMEAGASAAMASAAEPAPAKKEEPEAPAVDDASIWDMGGDSSDDDMSGDMFGGFGF